MTEKEALERTVNYIERQTKDEMFYSSKDENLDFAETIKKALEKQIPKKVISIIYRGDYKCPTCKNYIDITDDDLYVYEIEPPKYCDECGQALDWGSEEE